MASDNSFYVLERYHGLAGGVQNLDTVVAGVEHLFPICNQVHFVIPRNIDSLRCHHESHRKESCSKQTQGEF